MGRQAVVVLIRTPGQIRFTSLRRELEFQSADVFSRFLYFLCTCFIIPCVFLDRKRTSGESNDEWSGTADPNSSSDWGSTGRRRGGVLTAADGGRNGSSSSRKRATGASRRRTSARSRSSRAGGVDSVRIQQASHVALIDKRDDFLR